MPDFNFYVSPNGKLVRVTNASANDSQEAAVVPGGSERYAVNWHQFDDLMGRMLTIVDASFSDPEQRAAVKSLTRRSIKDWVVDIGEEALADERADASQQGKPNSTSFAAPDKAAA